MKKELLKLAVLAAKRAGARAGRASRRVVHDLRHDVKIAADREMEAVIVKTLSRGPAYPILTDEAGELPGRNHDYRWVVDPLDGSLNFSRGLPLNCVSIALWEGRRPVLGVVYDFNRGELFSGLAGQGAWLNGRRIGVGRRGKLSEAVLCTGFPAVTSYQDRALAAFLKQIKTFKKVRLLGSAALSLAYVACGRADAYRENDIKIWDVAGGLALVLAAGGRLKLADSAVENALRVTAANPRLLKKII